MSARGGEPRAADVVRAAAAAGTGLGDAAVRWERRVPPEPRLSGPPRPAIGLALDPPRLRLPASEVEPVQRPDGVEVALSHNVPQAFLRDLDKPAAVLPVPLEEHEGSQLLGRWRAGREQVAAALARPPLPRVLSTAEVFAAERERRRRFFGAPWQPLLADDQPRRRVDLYPTPE